jgi:hypothetical protein
MSREAGDRQSALRYAKHLSGLLPGNQDLRRLVKELEAK